MIQSFYPSEFSSPIYICAGHQLMLQVTSLVVTAFSVMKHKQYTIYTEAWQALNNTIWSTRMSLGKSFKNTVLFTKFRRLTNFLLKPFK